MVLARTIRSGVVGGLAWLVLVGGLGFRCPAHAQAASDDAPEVRADPYLVEAVTVRGNERTRPSVILGRVTVHPGTLLDETEVRRSRRQVQGLGLFRSVAMRLERGSAPGRVQLVVEVEERPSLMVSDLFLGFTGVSPAFGGFGISDRNLGGSGLIGTAAFVVGTDGRQGWRAGLHDPDFLGKDVAVGVTGLWLQGVEVHCPEGLGRCASAELDRLRYRRAGGIASFGVRPGRTSRVWTHYRLEALSAEGPAGPRPAGLPSLPEGSSLLSTLAVTFEYDTRDDAFVATRGTEASLSVEVGSALFWSDHDYSRYRFHLAQHLPTGKGRSLRLWTSGGLVQGKAPFFDRFVVSDYSYFTVGTNTVPRALELSFSEVSQYDDVLVAAGATWLAPLFSGGAFLYRGHLYLGAALTLSAESVDRSLLDLSFAPGNEVSRFPLSGDIGLRLDTAAGVFSLGLSYPLDLLF